MNATVFDPSRGALPYAADLAGGHLRRLSATPEDVIGVDTAGHAWPTTVALVGAATVQGRSVPLAGLNVSPTPNGLGVYTSEWGPQSRPSTSVAVIVRGGIVERTVTGAAAASSVPADRTVLASSGASTVAWLRTLRVGTPVNLSLRAVTGRNAAGHILVSAAAHSGYLIYNGAPRESCIGRAGLLRPRTAVGWRADGTVVVVTLQGMVPLYGARWGGATAKQLVELMVALGCREAVSLDGGGSTTFVARSNLTGRWARWDRANGNDMQRPVPNALVISAA